MKANKAATQRTRVDFDVGSKEKVTISYDGLVKRQSEVLKSPPEVKVLFF